MKQTYSAKWIGSKQPRKQRKYRVNAPLHVKRKLMAGHLSKELRKRHGKRSFPIRKGDNVKIMRGEFKGKTGKIEEPDYKKMRTTIEGIFRTKKDGTKVSVYFVPSNLQIKELNLEDVKRKKALDRKGVEKKTDNSSKEKSVKSSGSESKSKSDDAKSKTNKAIDTKTSKNKEDKK